MHHKITIILVFIAFSFLQDARCGIISLPNFTEFNEKLDNAFSREYERIDMLKTLTSRYDNLPFGDDEELKELFQKLKQVDIEVAEELTAYYDNLKAESLKNRQLPNMDEHEIEIKMFDISPKYVQKSLEIVKEALLNSEDADFLSDDDKNKIFKHLQKFADLVNEEIFIPIKHEIKAHIKEWKIIDPIYLTATNTTLNEQNQTPEVRAQLKKAKSIVEDFIMNKMGFLMECYDDFSQMAEKFQQRKKKIMKEIIEHTTLDPYEQWWEETHVGRK